MALGMGSYDGLNQQGVRDRLFGGGWRSLAA
jgi:hypothetical protein